ncbi:MAG: ABC transporter permease [Gemmatimonadetes bacterium]|nr:MAG: ABC transporter permease [Gemmatimonadota bacterium]
MIKKVQNLYYHREMLKMFIVRDLKERYAGSIMGLSWTILNPLILLVIFTFVFRVVLQVKLGGDGGIQHFALYLFCGMLPWLAFQEGIVRSTSVVIENANLIKKVLFPVKILPLYRVLASVISQLAGTFILLVAIAFILHKFTLALLFFPLLLVLQIAFTLGMSWFLATINVYLRDTAQLVPSLLMVWLYITPIFYPPTLIPAQFKLIVWLNPMAHLVDAYRRIFLEGVFPEIYQIGLLLGFSMLTLLIGFTVFQNAQRNFADLI